MPSFLVSSLLGFAGCALQSNATAPVDFARDVQPILEAQCVRCHGEKKQKAGLRLDLRRDALAGAQFGAEPVIVPKDSAGSVLFQRVTTDSDDDRMPQEAEPLAPREIEILRRWIDEGAVWPESDAERGEQKPQHWAYLAPRRPAVPEVAEREFVANPIDAFVLAGLAKEGLAHAPRADRATWLRRVSLDLIGLPPTVEELDRFLADASPDADRKVVERLLAAPQFGENWAAWWLDLARYADTNGYEKDDRRVMWRWRDWVIDAFNRNQRFDQFTIEQLAGDLLPNATLEQKLATGFHRNTMLNEEGGVNPEEFRVAAVVDRVNTTAAVWLGTTLGCAQCHNHKYDPFTQKDYYRMLAYFNSSADTGGARTPMLVTPTDAQAREVAAKEAAVARLREAFEGPWPELDRAQAEWEPRFLAERPNEIAWTVLPPVGWSASHATTLTRQSDDSLLASGENRAHEDFDLSFEPGTLRASGIRLELLTDPSLPNGGPGRAANGNCVITEVEVVRGSRTQLAKSDPIAIAAVDADYSQKDGDAYGFGANNTIDRRLKTHWAAGVGEKPGGRELRFAFAAPLELGADDLLHVRIKQQSPYPQHTPGRLRVSITSDASLAASLAPLEFGIWRMVGPFEFGEARSKADDAERFARQFEPEEALVRGGALAETYAQGALHWREEREWLDGEVHALDSKVGTYYLVRDLRVPSDRELEFSFGSDDSLVVWLDGRKLVEDSAARGVSPDQDRVNVHLTAGAHRLAAKVVNYAGPDGFYFKSSRPDDAGRNRALYEALAMPAEQRSAEQVKLIRDTFRSTVAPEGRERYAALGAASAELDQLRAALPTTMVMEELAAPRETHVFIHGDFRNQGELVEPGTPQSLPPAPADAPKNRLGLARWLVDPSNPLTARVTVNRVWERLFGVGIVPTSEDFGTRGDAPTHPELLDWLACEFCARGWDFKSLIETIVMSSTYAQASEVTHELYERDPQNRWCARGSRWRVDAEKVRDAVLATSGLLDTRLGGPSVFPYQPEGIWNLPYNGDQWVESPGGDRHRRGLYTFARRSSPYPTYNLFDAPTRELVCTRRARSNTPLQALALLNDPAFVEASGSFALRILREAKGDDRERATFAFRACTARKPDAAELEVLLGLLASERKRFGGDAQATQKYLTAVGANSASELDAVELAAWTVVASALFNLDETITRS